MNLAEGEKILEVLVASASYGELIPGPMEIQQLEFTAKTKLNGLIEAEMKIHYQKGVQVCSFPELDLTGLAKARAMIITLAKMSSYSGTLRRYDFSDCRNEQEMRFRYLLIPEYRAVKNRLSQQKVIPIAELKAMQQCPVCATEMTPAETKCPGCGSLTYKDGGVTYVESAGASFFPLRRDGSGEAEINLCKIDYVHAQRDFLRTHVTYIEEMPIYLGAVYTFVPPARPAEFRMILNIPADRTCEQEIFLNPYVTKRVDPAELKLLANRGVQVFCGSGTEPYLVVCFRVWDYTCLEEIANHVNYILMKYHDWLENTQAVTVH